jgi:hypothetical protein
MLNKFRFCFLGLLVGLIIGILVPWIYWAKTFQQHMQKMFIFQDRDIMVLELAATEAYKHESPEVGIWALENYLTFFNSVIEERIVVEEDNEKSDGQQTYFIFADPEDRWISYVRLGLLYEEIGKLAKYEECFQEAATILGAKGKGQEGRESMIRAVNLFDEDIND